ncbi:MAG: tetratricopeptide (TPR) repeat protein [Chlamydiales bacterium]
MNSNHPAQPAQPPTAVSPTPERRPRSAVWISALLLIAVAFATYSNALSGPFVFDDESAIVQNTHLRSLTPLTRSMGAPPGTGASGRPLVALSLALNHALGGLEVRGYRLFNVAVHALCALALFGLLRRTIEATRGQLPATALAFATSLLWVVHPLCTDAVDLVITRNEQLMALFYLTTLYCALRAFDPRSSRIWTMLAVASCALGMACKENMLSAPFAALLLDRFVDLERPRESLLRTLRRSAPFYAALASTWGVLILLAVGADRGATIGLETPMTPLAYFLSQTAVVPAYLGLAFWPEPLILDYGDWTTFRGQGSWFPAAAGLLLALSLCAWLVVKRHPLGVLGFVFLAVLAPTSSFIPITGEVAAEHRMYLPLAAVVLGVVLGARTLAARLSLKPVAARVFGAFLLAATVIPCATVTYARNVDYSTTESIWRDTVSKRPRNARAYCGLATELIRQDRMHEAMDQLERSLRVRPSSAESHRLLGLIFTRMGEPEQAQQHYRSAAQFLPSLPDYIYRISISALDAGDATFAASGLMEVLGMRPRFAPARRALGWIRAAAMAPELRDPEAALQLAQSLCETDPSAADLDLLAAALASRRRYEEAIATIEQALKQAQEIARTDPDMLAAMRSRRALYQKAQPYRGSPHRRTFAP